MNAPWRDVCCGFCVAKTVVPCDMATQSKTEAIVEKTWKLVATKYPQPGSPNRLKWDKYFAYFNEHFEGIQEPSPPEGLKPFASLWIIYKTGVQRSPAPSPIQRRAPAARVQLSLAPSIPLLPTPAAGGQHQHNPPVQPHRQTRRGQWPQVGTSTRATGTAAGGQQHQHQQQDQRQVTEEEQQQPGGEGADPSSSKRPRPAEDQALIQYLIQKVDTVQDTVNRLEASTGGTLLHGGAVRFPKNTQGMVYQLPTLLPYTGDVYQPHELEQCRRAALDHGLTIFQLPQLAIDMAAVVAASILITRVYNHMVFSSVNANSKTQYGTGQRVQVVLAKSNKNSSGDLDTTLTLLTDKYNAAVYNALTAEKKKEVDEAKKVLALYLTLLQPVLRQLLGRPLNALATIITDPTWQRRLNRTGKMVTTLAEQLAQAQAPHTDFLPVGPGMDDGLVFLLALQDFPLVAYMGSHKLSQLAAAHCCRTADGKKQVVEVKDMDALALTLPHQLGTEVLVKAGQLVLFRGNTVHDGNVGVAGSCCARLYGFGRPDTVADNTTMNTSELGDLYHGLFQPIQDEGIGPKMADWNRRGMAGQWDPVDQDSAVWSLDPVGPCGARTLWCGARTLWCQDPVVRDQDPVVPEPCDSLRDKLDAFELYKIVFTSENQMHLGAAMSGNDFAWVVTQALKPINDTWVETWNKSDYGVVTGKEPNLCLRLYALDEAQVTPTQPGSKSQPAVPSSHPTTPHVRADHAEDDYDSGDADEDEDEDDPAQNMSAELDDPISEDEEEEELQGKALAKQKAQENPQQQRVKLELGPISHAFVTKSATKHVKLLAVRGVDTHYPIPNVGHGELALAPGPGEVEDWWWPAANEAAQGYMLKDWVARYGRKLPKTWTFATGDKKVKEAVVQQRTEWSRFQKEAILAGKDQLVSGPVKEEAAKWWLEWGWQRKTYVLPEQLPASWEIGSASVDMEGDPMPLTTPALDTWTPYLRDDLQRVAGEVASTAGIQMDTAWQVVHEEMASLMPEFKALLQRLGDGAMARATSQQQQQQQQQQQEQQEQQRQEQQRQQQHQHQTQQQLQTQPEVVLQASLARYNDDVSPSF
ncbi:hypothetical protein QJQ45_008218 [Haematococcus lacustris]|nr:hypothetical protein QJQ45_008218 [Haematococcus lacustris]